MESSAPVSLPCSTNDVSPTVAEEKALFTDMTAPLIRLPPIMAGVHTQVTRPAARETDLVCYDNLPEFRSRAEAEHELLDKVVRVQFSAPQYIDIAPTVDEEKELFTQTTAPFIQLPSTTSSLHTEATASAARKSISTSSCRDSLYVMAREEPEDFFDGVVRICMPCTAPELVEEKTTSAPELERDEASIATSETKTAPEHLFATPQKLSPKLNPEASSFVPIAQLDLKKVSSSRYPDSKLNPHALSFVPEKKHLNPEAADFVPEMKSSTAILDPEAPVFIPIPTSNLGSTGFQSRLNPEAPAFVPRSSPAENVQLQVLGYAVGAADLVPITIPSLNPEGPVFHPGEQQQTLFEPEAAEFIPTPNPAHHLQSARSTLPDLYIATPKPFISPQCYEDRREAWLTEELFNYGLNNFGEGMVIHHYSFIGHPVMCKTSTPPATSLAIISGKPKLKEGYMLNQDDLHRHAMLYNALHLVDPVVYRGSADLLCDLKGTELENAVVGLVNKAYSRHGCWQEDHYDDYDDAPEYDPLNVRQYDEDEMYLNATSRLYYLTQPQPHKHADDSVNEAQRKQSRRENFTRVKSPLSQVMSAHEEDDAQVDDYFVVVNKKKSIVIEVRSPSSMDTGTGGPVDAVKHELLVDDKVAVEQLEAKFLVLDADKELASDAESIGTIHPECAISPLKIRKISIHPTEVVDKSLAISPLKARKPSDESTSTGHADQSPNENTSDESGTSTPATTDSDEIPAETSPLLAGSGPSTYGNSEKDLEQEQSPTVSLVSKSATSSALVHRPASLAIAYDKGMEAGGRSIPIASTLRPNRTGTRRNLEDTFGPLQDIQTRLNHYLIRNDDPWDPLDPSIYARSSIPRSPECYDLKRAAARPDLVRGDEYKIVVLSDPLPIHGVVSEQQPSGVLVLLEESNQAQSGVPILSEESVEEDDEVKVLQPYEAKIHMPHQLSPIKEVLEESPNKEFFRSDTKNIREIGEVGGHHAEDNALLEQSTSPILPRPLGFKRHATLSNLRGLAETQKDVTPTAETLTTSPESPARDESPIERPSAPTPSRMQRFPEPVSDDEDEGSPDSVSEELDEPLTSPTSEDSLADKPQSDSIALECESLVRSPTGKQRVFESWPDNNAPSSHFPPALTTRKSAALLPLYMSPSKAEDFAGLGTSVSPSPLPKTKKVFDPRVSSGTWLSGKFAQGSLHKDDGKGDETLLPVIRASTTSIVQSIMPREQAFLAGAPQATPPSQIGLALPYYPPQPTIAEPCMSLLEAPGTVYVAPPAPFGSAVQAFFNHSDPIEPSPSRSLMERVFKDFSGFHSVALDFGELSVDSLNTPHSPASVASTCSSNASITSNETVITTWQHERKLAQLAQTPSARNVLFSVRPHLRSSNWAKVENKLRKKSTGAPGVAGADVGVTSSVGVSEGLSIQKKDTREVKKGRLGKWVDRVFGRGKGKQ